jgi:hypothetical protein
MPSTAFSSGDGYRWLDVWVLANIVQIATQKFCRRFLDCMNDPCGRQFDQMAQAARSGVSNIAEGYSRRALSKVSERKPNDAARCRCRRSNYNPLSWRICADNGESQTRNLPRIMVLRIYIWRRGWDLNP